MQSSLRPEQGKKRYRALRSRLPIYCTEGHSPLPMMEPEEDSSGAGPVREGTGWGGAHHQPFLTQLPHKRRDHLVSAMDLGGSAHAVPVPAARGQQAGEHSLKGTQLSPGRARSQFPHKPFSGFFRVLLFRWGSEDFLRGG